MEVCRGRSHPNARNITYMLDTTVHVDFDSKADLPVSHHMGRSFLSGEGEVGPLPFPYQLKLLDTPKLWLKKVEGKGRLLGGWFADSLGHWRHL